MTPPKHPPEEPKKLFPEKTIYLFNIKYLMWTSTLQCHVGKQEPEEYFTTSLRYTKFFNIKM